MSSLMGPVIAALVADHSNFSHCTTHDGTGAGPTEYQETTDLLRATAVAIPNNPVFAYESTTRYHIFFVPFVNGLEQPAEKGRGAASRVYIPA